MENVGELLFQGKRFERMIAKSRGHFTMIYNSFIMSQDFSGYEKLVWVVLKKYKMTHNTCWPSHKTIAERTGWSISTIKKALKGLESKGMIKIERKPNHRSNVYSVFDLPSRPPP